MGRFAGLNEAPYHANGLVSSTRISPPPRSHRAALPPTHPQNPLPGPASQRFEHRANNARKDAPSREAPTFGWDLTYFLRDRPKLRLFLGEYGPFWPKLGAVNCPTKSHPPVQHPPPSQALAQANAIKERPRRLNRPVYRTGFRGQRASRKWVCLGDSPIGSSRPPKAAPSRKRVFLGVESVIRASNHSDKLLQGLLFLIPVSRPANGSALARKRDGLIPQTGMFHPVFGYGLS